MIYCVSQLAIAEERHKKALGEVECQRHNADAARQSLEHKLKEAEKTQKAELASLTDTMRDMQRHMDESAAKAAQELKKVSQCSKQQDYRLSAHRFKATNPCIR